MASGLSARFLGRVSARWDDLPLHVVLNTIFTGPSASAKPQPDTPWSDIYNAPSWAGIEPCRPSRRTVGISFANESTPR